MSKDIRYVLSYLLIIFIIALIAVNFSLKDDLLFNILLGVGIMVFSCIIFYFDYLNKRKALSFRIRAYKALQENDYEEAKYCLIAGIHFIKKSEKAQLRGGVRGSSYLFFTGRSLFHRKMRSYLMTLESALSQNNSEQIERLKKDLNYPFAYKIYFTYYLIAFLIGTAFILYVLITQKSLITFFGD